MTIYKKGQVVYERMRPNQKLVVVDINGNIYSCIAQEHPSLKALTYFERDLNPEIETSQNKNDDVNSIRELT